MVCDSMIHLARATRILLTDCGSTLWPAKGIRAARYCLLRRVWYCAEANADGLYKIMAGSVIALRAVRTNHRPRHPTAPCRSLQNESKSQGSVSMELTAPNIVRLLRACSVGQAKLSSWGVNSVALALGSTLAGLIGPRRSLGVAHWAVWVPDRSHATAGNKR